MNFLKRIVLFFAINFLVVAAISLILNLLHVGPFLKAHGLDLTALAIFCLVWGMVGSLISLSLSRIMAKWMLGVHVIDPHTRDPNLRELVELVYQLAQQARLPEMPEVGIYESREVNAFATGPTRRRSLVAVSSGLLNQMSKRELEGVLAHEITHIANGDMVTMTLIQGIVNAFVMFLARALAYVVSGMGKDRERSSVGGGYYVLVFLFEIVFMFLGWLVIAAFSRYREFRADAGGAELAGKEKMIGALQALQKTYERRDVRAEQPAIQALKISTHPKGGLMRLLATHPPLDERIARLEQTRIS